MSAYGEDDGSVDKVAGAILVGLTLESLFESSLKNADEDFAHRLRDLKQEMFEMLLCTNPQELKLKQLQVRKRMYSMIETDLFHNRS